MGWPFRFDSSSRYNFVILEPEEKDQLLYLLLLLFLSFPAGNLLF